MTMALAACALVTTTSCKMFNLPTPEGVLVEGCLESEGAYADKALGLWRIANLA